MSKPKIIPKVIKPRDEEFRECVFTENTTCIDDLASQHIPGKYDTKVTINQLEPFEGENDIFSETLFVAGNTSDTFRIIKLYYWQR